MKKILFLILLLVVISCSKEPTSNVVVDTPSGNAEEEFGQLLPEWMRTPLTNVNTGNEFAITDFAGKSVLVHIFSVRCQSCLEQQQEILALHRKIGEDDVVSVAIDIDDTESSEDVREHTTANGFNWRYVVASAPVTESLLDLYGPQVLSVAQSPVVLVCPNFSTRLLSEGLKSAQQLESEVEQGCEPQ